MEADKDRDGKISFDEFTKMVENTDISMSMTLGKCRCVSCFLDKDGFADRPHRPILNVDTIDIRR